jgi:SOS-response transcriptional repressor LexA
MDLGKRIHDLRHNVKMTAQELAESIGVSQSYISLLENNKRRANVEVLGKIAAVFKVSLSQVFAEEYAPGASAQAMPQRAAVATGAPGGIAAAGRPGINLDVLFKSGILQGSVDANGNVTGVTMRFIPIVSKVAAGDPATYTDGDYQAGFAEEYVPAPADLNDRNAFALRIAGDSMSPRFRDGDIVICSPRRPAENGDAVVAKVNAGETTCKIYYLDGRNVILSPVNSRYSAQVYPVEEIKWIYPVVICQRREKQ